LSVAVLNLNNMRDVQSDKKAGKNTIVVKMGLAKAKLLHYGFVIIAFLTALKLLIYFYFQQNNIDKLMVEPVDHSDIYYLLFFAPLLAFIPLFIHLFKVKRTQSPALLDPELKKVALSTFLFALLCILSVYLVTT
jgi:1,4-dihydroxy-2-naphthoate octaprenyltransferase